MSFFVHTGPAALSHKGCNGRRYWTGYASGNQMCAKSRATSAAAIRDARKIEQELNRVQLIKGEP